MWWMIVTLIGVVALVVGPVAMLQLNPLERRQQTLRQAARERGLQVKLQPQVRPGHETVIMPIYRLPGAQAKAWRLSRADYLHELHVLGWWQWETRLRPPPSAMPCLEAVLAQLPTSVELLGSDGAGVYAGWRERGGEKALEAMYNCLQEVSKINY